MTTRMVILIIIALSVFMPRIKLGRYNERFSIVSPPVMCALKSDKRLGTQVNALDSSMFAGQFLRMDTPSTLKTTVTISSGRWTFVDQLVVVSVGDYKERQ